MIKYFLFGLLSLSFFILGYFSRTQIRGIPFNTKSLSVSVEYKRIGSVGYTMNVWLLKDEPELLMSQDILWEDLEKYPDGIYR
jgi:hypothetical protein